MQLNNGEGDSSQLSDGVAEDTKPEQTDIQPDVKAKKKKKKKKKTVKDQTDNEVTSRVKLGYSGLSVMYYT